MLRLVLLVASAICFAIAVLVAVGAIGSNFDAWLAGGLLAYMLAVLVPIVPTVTTTVPPA